MAGLKPMKIRISGPWYVFVLQRQPSKDNDDARMWNEALRDPSGSSISKAAWESSDERWSLTGAQMTLGFQIFNLGIIETYKFNLMHVWLPQSGVRVRLSLKRASLMPSAKQFREGFPLVVGLGQRPGAFQRGVSCCALCSRRVKYRINDL